MVRALEVAGIIAGPPPLTRSLAGFAALRIAAIGLRLGVTIVWLEGLFAPPTQPFSDALHDPVPPGQSSNIEKKQGRKGLKAGKKRKKRDEIFDYEEKPKAEEETFSKRHCGGTFRPPVTTAATRPFPFKSLPNLTSLTTLTLRGKEKI